MQKNIMTEELMCNIVYDRMLSELCFRWYSIHIKKNLTEEDQIEKKLVYEEIKQFHKDHYDFTEYDD